ncbi:alpha/beta hydrolase [Pseudoroseicyclus tamaricis]|uniref:Alpha/beta hydrolase n=1 Tax=Pseudoroseicyclus tamaricis TaxID=2705421 RepID=A0A6B2JID7_9RHOB|nr:alpha/beta hydrolase [Pseudoroseicyclus tamaricis]NDV01133.1 alpha/beta hydrolase [Pseudoroseicyclus tamaricis]
MPSPEALAEIEAIRARPRKSADAPMDLAADRAAWAEEAAKEPLPEGTEITEEVVGGVSCERIVAPPAEDVARERIAAEAAQWAAVGASAGAAPGPVRGGDAAGLLLFLHGGGYTSGGPVTHRKLAAHLSARTGLPVLLPDYRLAPEAPFPAALEDALAVTRALLQDGQEPETLALGGDSAGGGLAAALMLKLKDEGLPQPACAVLLSPWTDILARGGSYEANVPHDPSMDAARLREAGRLYTGEADPLDPLISPLEGELSGLPPLLIHVGGAELMLDDSLAFAERARDAGAEVELTVWDGMWHVHHHALTVPEAQEAVAEAAAFIRAKLPG